MQFKMSPLINRFDYCYDFGNNWYVKAAARIGEADLVRKRDMITISIFARE